jgi:hypothetical protein
VLHTWVRVSVHEASVEQLVKRAADAHVDDALGIKVKALDLLHFGELDAVEPLHGENGATAKLGKEARGGNRESTGVAFCEQAAEALHVLGLTVIISLLEDATDKVVDKAGVVGGAWGVTLEAGGNGAEPTKDESVESELAAKAGALDFDGNIDVTLELGSVNLAKRGSSDRFAGEVAEERVGAVAELMLEDGADVGERHRGEFVLERCELESDGRWHKVWACGERLTKLDERGAKA